MPSNPLIKLNANKTELIRIGTRQQLAKVNVILLLIKGQSITPSGQVRDLNVLIDNKLKTDDYVRNVVRGCVYQLRQLRSVRRSLTTDARRTLAKYSRSDDLLYLLWHLLPRLKTKFGERAFSHAGRSAWNACPPTSAIDVPNSDSFRKLFENTFSLAFNVH